MAPAPSFAVVICAYTEARWDNLVEAVDSVVAQTRPTAEIIVVIDHNDSLLGRAQADLAQTGTDPAASRVRVIANAERQGLSGARNTGTRSSKADIVAFLDDDASAAKDWLERLVGSYSTSMVVGVGGRIDPVWATKRPSWWPPEFDWVVGCTYRGMPDSTTEVRNVFGANMSFRRSTILAAGGFDVGTGRSRGRPLGGEETELSIRIARRRPDARIRYEPLARVRHHVPTARSTFRYFVERCYAEGLSKARVARLVGRREGLATERRYVRQTLAAAVFRDVNGALRHRDPSRFARVAAMAIGLLVTSTGYVVGSMTRVVTRSGMAGGGSDSGAAAL